MTLTGSLAVDLAKREADGRPIRIGLIGSGDNVAVTPPKTDGEGGGRVELRQLR